MVQRDGLQIRCNDREFESHPRFQKLRIVMFTFLKLIGHYVFVMVMVIFITIVFRLFSYGWFETVSIFTMAFYSVPALLFIAGWFAAYSQFIKFTKKAK